MSEERPFTVLIAGGGTGGHLMPALAIATALRTARPESRVVLAGAERGVEARLLPTRDFPFHLLPAEPLYRRQWWKNLRWPFRVARLLREVDRLLEAERPDVVVGTGGYAAGPVVWRAARRGIPTAIQEQNAFPGLATRLLQRRVRHIYLGVPEARRLLRPGPGTELYDIGTPITPPDPARRGVALERFGLTTDAPVVLVTGGSQGSLVLNRAVASWLATGGAKGRVVLWATGPATWPRFQHFHAPPAVQVFDFLDPIADAYAVADLAVTRAGAMTLAELAAWRLPGILVPLPTAAGNHQTHNARAMSGVGASVQLPQGELSSERLGRTVDALLADPGKLAAMGAAAGARARPDAASRIAALVGTLSG